MNLRVQHVALTPLVVRVIRILIRQHAHAVTNGSRTLVLQRHRTAIRLHMVVVQRILQRQVLKVIPSATVLQHRRLADTLRLHVRFVLDNGTLHALSHQCDIVTGNAGQRDLTEIIKTIGDEDVGALSVCRLVEFVGLIDGRQQTLDAAFLHDNDSLCITCQRHH